MLSAPAHCGSAAAPMALKLRLASKVPAAYHLIEYKEISGSNGVPRVCSGETHENQLAVLKDSRSFSAIGAVAALQCARVQRVLRVQKM